MWQFVQDHPAEFITLLSLILGTIGSIYVHLQKKTEQRLEREIKLLAQSQTNQSDRLETTAKLAETLYHTIERQLDQASKIEAELRARLTDRESEYAAQGKALRELHIRALDLEHDLRSCQKKCEAQQADIERSERDHERSERDHADVLEKYLQQQDRIRLLQQHVAELEVAIQAQSADHDLDRKRLAYYDDREFDTGNLGALPPVEEQANGDDRDA